MAEIGAGIVRIALSFVPDLLDVPVLGRIIQSLYPGGGNDFEALTQIQRKAAEKQQERKTRIEKQARYVLKASDAMKCVEDNLMSGGFLLAMGKGILNWALGRAAGASAPDVLCDKIFDCIESKTLKQTGKRKKKAEPYYGRPAKGHGHGRKPIAPTP